MKTLRWINLVLAFAVVLAPAAHALEMPNKLALDGPLWLGVQQHLYRGWGPFWGAPVELGALLTSTALGIMRRHDRATLRPTLLAVVAYVGMLAAWYAFDRPVNGALSQWTAATLPPDWPDYRQRWETGHALAAALSLIGLVALVRGWLIERDKDATRGR